MQHLQWENGSGAPHGHASLRYASNVKEGVLLRTIQSLPAAQDFVSFEDLLCRSKTCAVPAHDVAQTSLPRRQGHRSHENHRCHRLRRLRRRLCAAISTTAPPPTITRDPSPPATGHHLPSPPAPLRPSQPTPWLPLSPLPTPRTIQLLLNYVGNGCTLHPYERSTCPTSHQCSIACACADSTSAMWIVWYNIYFSRWTGSWSLGWSRTRPEAADLMHSCCCRSCCIPVLH